MGTCYLVLWLEAPLQSWGVDSKFNRRDTLQFPTKSGVYGLILSALGASGPQRELLARLAPMPLTVYRYGPIKGDHTTLLADFHMVGSGYNEKNRWENFMIPKKIDGSKAVGAGTKLTYRYYLQDAYFGCIIEIQDRDLADRIGQALEKPVYDLYLGRRCCVPSDRIWRGCYNSFQEAKEQLESIATERALRGMFYVIEGNLPEQGNVLLLNDVPIQFGEHKVYRDRWVTIVPVG